MSESESDNNSDSSPESYTELQADQFQRTMPVLEITDMDRSIKFYRDSLGFDGTMWGEPVNFAIMQRGTVTLALDLSQQASTANNQYWASYIYVKDVDLLYEEYQALGVTIQRPIEDTHYGCRDFDVMDPDGYLLAFGQVLGTCDTPPGLSPDGGRDELTKRTKTDDQH